MTDAPHLLGPGDPPPYTLLNEGGAARCIIVCDHAGTAVPRSLGLLGLEAQDFGRHWAVDVGAGNVSRRLSQLLDAPLLLGNYSRVVVDTNRRPDHPTLLPQTGEGTPIPGNANLREGDKQTRIEEIYLPFHRRLAALIDSFEGRGITPAIVAIHSFTPVFFKLTRPWDVGVLWLQDPRIPVPLMEFFRRQSLCVGDNQPYDARMLRGSTLSYHADARRLPSALIEIRNDLICDSQGGAKIAELCAQGLEKILADESLYTLYDGPLYQFDPQREERYFEDLVAKAMEGKFHE